MPRQEDVTPSMFFIGSYFNPVTIFSSITVEDILTDNNNKINTMLLKHINRIVNGSKKLILNKIDHLALFRNFEELHCTRNQNVIFLSVLNCPHIGQYIVIFSYRFFINLLQFFQILSANRQLLTL